MENLDFDKLVDSYYENLVTTLRNFSPGPEFLDTWVHDENPNESLYGLFEAACDGGVKELSVKVSSDRAKELDYDWLELNLNKLGMISFKKSSTETILSLSFKARNKICKIHPAYQSGLKLVTQNLEHQGDLFFSTDTESDIILKAEEAGIFLSCLIGKDGLVLQAKFKNAQGDLIPLMEKFCKILVHRPLQEGAEHGAIRLEGSLRDLTTPPPVLGLVTPENADPLFSIPTKLIRKIYADFLKHGKTDGWNDWIDPTPDSWVNLSEQSKIIKMNQLIRELCQELSFPYENIEVLTIKSGNRVVLSGHSYLKIPDFGRHLLVIERELKKRLQVQVDLILESLEDRNKRETRTSREP